MSSEQHDVSNKFRTAVGQLDPPPRLLLGPGPCNAHPRVLSALACRQIGHLDPFFIHLMNEIKDLLRYGWQTENNITFPVSGTGSGAMEASLTNIVEEGDVVLIGCNGYFSERLAEMAERYRAVVKKLVKPWGQVFTLAEIEEGLKQYKPSLLFLVHAETSTGALQPMEGIGELCKKYNALLGLDTVTSLGGVPIFLDAWGVDVAYSGSQKCLSCPPGISPITFSSRALEKIHNRKTKVPVWYFDVTLVSKYWGGNERSYHHTAPINMNYALREALRLLAEEGLENRWKRHKDNAKLLWSGLEKLGLRLHVEETYRLPPLTTVVVPDGVDAKKVIGYLRDKYNIEISGGLGELAGKVWRIGLMGFNSRPEVVASFLACFEDALESTKR